MCATDSNHRADEDKGRMGGHCTQMRSPAAEVSPRVKEVREHDHNQDHHHHDYLRYHRKITTIDKNPTTTPTTTITTITITTTITTTSFSRWKESFLLDNENNGHKTKERIRF
ncbi:hypothetical protein PoB_001964300 [Plakobranchus ocellatus]|uniref:Uncharacterized protein n=1 Tax=Plakobranchus ocellatus TaxID=259542 RepID=A0AAV3ZEG5_9GAST|nr:hypothetical protein PoB_001964300 [Plakobranchus ocellatus]